MGASRAWHNAFRKSRQSFILLPAQESGFPVRVAEVLCPIKNRIVPQRRVNGMRGRHQRPGCSSTSSRQQTLHHLAPRQSSVLCGPDGGHGQIVFFVHLLVTTVLLPFRGMVPLASNVSQPSNNLFSIAQLTCRTSLVSIRFSLKSHGRKTTPPLRRHRCGLRRFRRLGLQTPCGSRVE